MKKTTSFARKHCHTRNEYVKWMNFLYLRKTYKTGCGILKPVQHDVKTEQKSYREQCVLSRCSITEPVWHKMFRSAQNAVTRSLCSATEHRDGTPYGTCVDNPLRSGWGLLAWWFGILQFTKPVEKNVWFCAQDASQLSPLNMWSYRVCPFPTSCKPQEWPTFFGTRLVRIYTVWVLIVVERALTLHKVPFHRQRSRKAENLVKRCSDSSNVPNVKRPLLRVLPVCPCDKICYFVQAKFHHFWHFCRHRFQDEKCPDWRQESSNTNMVSCVSDSFPCWGFNSLPKHRGRFVSQLDNSRFKPEWSISEHFSFGPGPWPRRPRQGERNFLRVRGTDLTSTTEHK